MNIKILGTGGGGGIPTLFCECERCKEAVRNGEFRSRCCIVVNETVMIDFPVEIRYFVWKRELDINKINAVFMTHSHGDHFNPMDLVMNFGITTAKDIENPLRVFANEQILGILDKKISDMSKYTLTLLQPYKAYETDLLKVTALPAAHDPAENCYVFVCSDASGDFLYCTDSDMLNDEALKFLKNYNFKGAFFDCTWGNNVLIDKGHMGLFQINQIREYLLSHGMADQDTYWGLTHISHRSFTREFIRKAKSLKYNILNDGQELVF